MLQSWDSLGKLDRGGSDILKAGSRGLESAEYYQHRACQNEPWQAAKQQFRHLLAAHIGCVEGEDPA